MQESKDIQRFKEFYSKLPENYQSIVSTAILEMEKEHKIEATKKQISIKDVIGFYLKKNKMTQYKLLQLCREIDSGFSEDTYKSMRRRNLANIKDNATFKTVAEVLNIPLDDNGTPYVEYDIPDGSQTGGISKHRVYPFTSDYYSYVLEFQTNTVFQNFECLSAENRHAAAVLAESLYYNLYCPELFMPSDDF